MRTLLVRCRKKSFLAIVALTLSAHLLSAQSSGDDFNPLVVDKVLPPYCDIHVTSASIAKGSPAYIRLVFAGEALKTAEIASGILKKSMEDVKKARNYTELFNVTLPAQQQTIDYLKCSAQIMSRYKPAGQNEDGVSAVTLMIAFNQEAHAMELLRASQKRRFTRPEEPTPKQALQDSEELETIQALQREAASSITTATLLVGAEAADMSDEKAKKIEYLQLSCAELAEINQLLSFTAKEQSTVYGQSAKGLMDALKPFKCR